MTRRTPGCREVPTRHLPRPKSNGSVSELLLQPEGIHTKDMDTGETARVCVTTELRTDIIACLPKPGCMEAQSVVRACEPAEIDIDGAADASVGCRLVGKATVYHPHRIRDAFKNEGYSFVRERGTHTEWVAEEIHAVAFRVGVGVVGLEMRLS